MAINVTARPGERSDAVRELQSALAYLGYYRGPIDGYYGPQTQQAVRSLQSAIRAAGYDPGPIDGWFGARTQAAFNAWDRAVNGGGGGGGGGGSPPPTTTPPGQNASPPTPPSQPPAGATPVSPSSSARDVVRDLLRSYGLEELVDWAMGQLGEDAVFNEQAFMARLRQQDAYKRRFAGNEMRVRNGMATLSESEYLALEDAYKQVARTAGLPPGFYDDPSDFATLIGNNVSVSEYSTRVNMVINYVETSPQAEEVRAALQEFYGLDVSLGDLAAYVIDPDRALPLIERQFRAAAARARGVAAGLRPLDKETSEWLGAFTDERQQQAISEAAELSPLLEEWDTIEEDITERQALSMTLEGNAEVGRKLENRRRKRIAEVMPGQAEVVVRKSGRTTLV